MVNVYTNRKYLKDGEIYENKGDLYFGLFNKTLSSQEKMLIEKIENAVFLNDTDIKTPYGVCSIFDMSTGSKLLINVLQNPNTVFDVTECGRNVLEELFKQIDNTDTKIVLRHSDFELPEGITLLVNDGKEALDSMDFGIELAKDWYI